MTLQDVFQGYRPLCTHFQDLLEVLNLIHQLHLCHPHDVLELLGRPDDHTQQKQKQQKQQQRLVQQRGAHVSPPFVVPVLVGAYAVFVSVLCDQDDQVVPAHQVNDVDEVHELDPRPGAFVRPRETTPKDPSHAKIIEKIIETYTCLSKKAIAKSITNQ